MKVFVDWEAGLWLRGDKVCGGDSFDNFADAAAYAEKIRAEAGVEPGGLKFTYRVGVELAGDTFGSLTGPPIEVALLCCPQKQVADVIDAFCPRCGRHKATTSDCWCSFEDGYAGCPEDL